MLYDKFFNPFISDTFWRHPHLSKLRVRLADASNSFTLGLSQRFFLSAEEEVDGMVYEEAGQLRLHLRSIFAYNRAAFHAAKWETAAVGGFVQLADLFFSKQKCYWAGEGNWGSHTGGASPLFFQNLSNFSTVTSFERILFSSEARATLGRFLLRFNQTAPFYLNGLGRRNTLLVNYRARPQSQFLREFESTTKTPVELFDTFFSPAHLPINLKNGNSLVTLHSRGFALGMPSQQTGTLRLAYLNDFASFLCLSDQYRRRHLVCAYGGFAFGNDIHAANFWIPSPIGWSAGDLYAAYGFFNTARRAVLKIAPRRKKNLLISYGFAHSDQDNFSIFALASRSVYRAHVRRLTNVIPLSRARILMRAYLQMKWQLLRFYPHSREPLGRVSAPATYEINRLRTFRSRYQAGLAYLSEWEAALASKYMAVLAETANLESERTLNYNNAWHIAADIKRTVIENYTLTLDTFARDLELVKAKYEDRLKLLEDDHRKTLHRISQFGKLASTAEIDALEKHIAKLAEFAAYEYLAIVKHRFGIALVARGDVNVTSDPVVDRAYDLARENVEDLKKSVIYEDDMERRMILWRDWGIGKYPRDLSAYIKRKPSTSSLDLWLRAETGRISVKQAYAKKRIRIASLTCEKSRYTETSSYMRFLFSKTTLQREKIVGPDAYLKRSAAMNYRLAWLYSRTPAYKALISSRRAMLLIKKRNRRTPRPRTWLQPLTFTGARKPRGAEKLRSAGPVTGVALGFLQTVLTAIAATTSFKLTSPADNLNLSTIRRSYYRLWFNKLVLGGGGAFFNHRSNLLFMVFDRTGALKGRALGIVGQLFWKAFYARRYLKLFSAYNEFALTQMRAVASKHWRYRLAKANERASIRSVRRVATRVASLKYVELLATKSNALTCMRTHAETALMETSEIGLIGFARAGASKHHAEFFLLFSGAQSGGTLTLANHRMLSPVDRFTASRSRRQPTRLNFDMEFFDRIAGVMWSTNVAFPTNRQARLGNPLVMSQFNVTLGRSSFAPEYRCSWFFNTLDSVQDFGLTRTILGGDVAAGTFDFNRELAMCLPWSAGFFGIRSSAALLRSSIQLVNLGGEHVPPLIATVFWGRINSLLFYDL